MENTGWIKLHNKFLDWEWFDDPLMVKVFLFLILTANYKDNDWQGQKILRGQTIVGRRNLAKTLNISEQQTRTCLERLKSTHEITIKSTNRYSIITLINWDKYQGRLENQPAENSTSQPTINQQATNKQPHSKNIRSKEYKKDTSEPSSPEIPKLIELFKEVNPSYGKWFGNTTQRSACDRLLKIHGLEKLKRIISFLPRSNLEQYSPVVTSPLQLEDKFSQLESFWRKQANKTPLLNL